ncbi:4153_t:CDS:1, partial [Funneliformis geosporum]
AFVMNYYYGTDINKINEIEKQYDTLSVVKPGQSLVGWAMSVRIRLQELLTNQRF